MKQKGKIGRVREAGGRKGRIENVRIIAMLILFKKSCISKSEYLSSLNK